MKRYSPVPARMQDGGRTQMVEDPDGDYVKVGDLNNFRVEYRVVYPHPGGTGWKETTEIADLKFAKKVAQRTAGIIQKRFISEWEPLK